MTIKCAIKLVSFVYFVIHLVPDVKHIQSQRFAATLVGEINQVALQLGQQWLTPVMSYCFGP